MSDPCDLTAIAYWKDRAEEAEARIETILRNVQEKRLDEKTYYGKIIDKLREELEEAIAQQGTDAQHVPNCHFLWGVGRQCDCWVPDARAALEASKLLPDPEGRVIEG